MKVDFFALSFSLRFYTLWAGCCRSRASALLQSILHLDRQQMAQTGYRALRSRWKKPASRADALADYRPIDILLANVSSSANMRH